MGEVEKAADLEVMPVVVWAEAKAKAERAAARAKAAAMAAASRGWHRW